MERQPSEKQQRVSETFTVSRAIAILSVIVAHTTFPVKEGSVTADLMTCLGSIGVVVFFLVSGYYFNPAKYGSLGGFLKPKITSLVLPWVIMSTVVFVAREAVMGWGGFGLLEYGKFLVGHGSYLYYLTVLVVCYLVYFYLVKQDWLTSVCLVSVLLTVASLLLTAFGLLDVTGIYLTDYLNPLNWVGYFCLGVWLKRADVDRLMRLCRRFLWALVLLYGGLFALAHFVLHDQMGYFGYLGMPMQLVGAMIVIGVCSFGWMNNPVLRYVAKASFGVYLVHMFTLPVVHKFLGEIPVVNFLIPVITLAATATGFFLLDFVAKKMKLTNVFRLITGVR